MLPRLIWLLMIYEMTITIVEAIERKINSHLRRWLEVPPTFTAISLYSRSSQIQLATFNINFGGIQDIKEQTCNDSQRLSKSGILTRTGRKWLARTAVDQAESILQHKDIVGNTCTGRQGLGVVHFQQWSKATPNEKSNMVHSEVRQVEEEQRRAKTVELSRQGAWI
ncbi:unnamed protein product [Mytilus coruscus]|uniref:Uncharacterized protein n=1 Tax=Mytilus coruscus TaxID=42192 RepID=A0A6J8A5G3_MYTCO|nr:unnamed protein product [Mytilus coruscus]